MCEYGGYIEFEYYHGREYHEHAIALNSGRHCVEYLIRTRHISKIYMPYFMCDSVSTLCDRLGVEVDYYHIDIHFIPQFNRQLAPGEWLYIVNFYGQLTDGLISCLKKKYQRIIVDYAQSFFRKPLESVDTCYTCRKFFGVSDGGYLYTDQMISQELPLDYSYDRMEFLFGRMEKGANEFYPQYCENNELFAHEELKKMSKLTQNLLCGLDYMHIKQIRTENFAYLDHRLKTINKLSLSVSEGAFMYPLYVDGGAAIRIEMQKRKIYVPTLWPDVFGICTEDDLEYDMAKNILPLPVDQRYRLEDMDHILEILEKIMEE